MGKLFVISLSRFSVKKNRFRPLFPVSNLMYMSNIQHSKNSLGADSFPKSEEKHHCHNGHYTVKVGYISMGYIACLQEQQ